MKKVSLLIVLCLSLSSKAQDFIVAPTESIGLTGYVDGVRTVWFSADNTMIHADGAHLLTWQIQSGRLTQQVEIPGYNTYQSRVSANHSLWIQANSNYNNPEKKAITDMHANLNVFLYAADQMSSHKITEGYNIHEVDFLEFRPNQILVVTSSAPTYIYELKIFSLETFKAILTVKKCDSDKDIMSCVATSEDGKIAAVGYAGKNGRVEIWDMENLKLIGTANVDSEISKVAIANGTCAASGTGKVHIIDISNANLKKSVPTTAGTFALAISPNGKTIAVGDRAGGADVVDVETGAVQHFYDGQCQSLAFNNEGNMLAVGVFKTMHIADIPSVILFFNENEVKSTNETTEENVVIEKIENTWQQYSSVTPTFSISVPAEANEKTTKNKSGARHVQVKCYGKTAGALVDFVEAKKIKNKKYYSTAVSVADKFISNLGEVKLLEKTDWFLNGQKGVEMKFTKKEFVYYYRAILIDGYLLQLTFFTKDESSSEHETFFDSLVWDA